jgi:hypothetical protein
MTANPPRWSASVIEQRLSFRPDRSQHSQRLGQSGKSSTTPDVFQPQSGGGTITVISRRNGRFDRPSKCIQSIQKY